MLHQLILCFPGQPAGGGGRRGTLLTHPHHPGNLCNFSVSQDLWKTASGGKSTYQSRILGLVRFEVDAKASLTPSCLALSQLTACYQGLLLKAYMWSPTPVCRGILHAPTAPTFAYTLCPALSLLPTPNSWSRPSSCSTCFLCFTTWQNCTALAPPRQPPPNLRSPTLLLRASNGLHCLHLAAWIPHAPGFPPTPSLSWDVPYPRILKLYYLFKIYYFIGMHPFGF